MSAPHPILTLLVGLGALACRPDPGDPAYPDLGSASDDTGEGSDLPEGPDPYEEGEARLSLGAFYESGYSEIVPIDDTTTHYYIYSDTYSQGVDTQDVVEGRESAVIEHGDVGWFGGGITWDAGGDLSDWTTLYVSLRSGDDSFGNLSIRMLGGTEVALAAADYGWATDGQWNHLAFPLADFEAGGVDLGAVTGPFIFIGEGGAPGDLLKIDNLYLTQD